MIRFLIVTVCVIGVLVGGVYLFNKALDWLRDFFNGKI